MINKILFVLLALIIVIPIGLFYGIKYSPLSLDLLDPINTDNSIALKGYDPVSYYIDKTPIKGDPNKGLKIGNVIYRFATDENKLMFKTFPEKFIPQYGGYCASAVSTGFTADISPNYWHIENDRLFLFFNQSAKDEFKSNLLNNTKSADEEWKKYQL